MRLLLVGPVAFVLGLTIFATNYAFLATPSGNANRIFIAAAVGVALTMVGGTALLVRVLHSMRLRAAIFAAAIGLLCFCGVAVNNALAQFWVRAAVAQAEVIERITSEVPFLPQGSTLLLDGVCPYIGPGIVFEAPWDLAGVLQLAYGDPSLRADIVTPSLEIRDDAVVTRIYAVPSTYPYSNLRVFDARRGGLTAIENASALRQVFGRADPDQGAYCGAGGPGTGGRIF